jgi:hemerythrin-like domain-containing protein
MDPLANLAEDHVHIALALDAVDALVAQAGVRELDFERYASAVAFIDRWADGAHYDKEGLLFDELGQAGMPRDFGPIEFLELEHSVTRGQTAKMREALAAIASGDATRWLELIGLLNRYVATVRIHMPKEDGCCFPIAKSVLSAAARERLGPQFDAINGALPMSFAEAAAALRAERPDQAPPHSGAAPASPPQPYSDAAIERLAQSLDGQVLNPTGPCRRLGIVRRR